MIPNEVALSLSLHKIMFRFVQIPCFETRSDGRDNFVGALILAGNYNIPEVCVYFRHQLMRGNRVVIPF